MVSELEDSPAGDLPDEVVASLRARYGHGPVVAETTDQVVLADAASHLNSACRRQRPWRWIHAGLPLAAAAGLLLLILPQSDSPRSPAKTNVLEMSAERTRTSGPAEARMIAAEKSRDINRDGQVNILDAFLLARLVKASRTDPGSGDLNQDGAVDQQDIKLIADDAVLLTMN